MTLSPEFPWLIAVGFIAQLIDGCVGMGYGIFASTVLATLGVPPATTSATVHASEVFTSGISSVSHAWFRNIDRTIFFSLLVPGVIGGVVGASLLAHVPTQIVRPFVWMYLLVTSFVILRRVLLSSLPIKLSTQGPGLGIIAGFLDAVGGGGWGTIVTSTMIARGISSRYAIGTANAAEFFVSLATSITLWIQLDVMSYDMVLGLLIGGVAAAPFAAWITRHVPHRAAAITVSILVFALGLTGLIRILT